MNRQKPIKVFWSPLSRRFYASQHYKQDADGEAPITGEKFDVTNDIGTLIQQYEIEFKQVSL